MSSQTNKDFDYLLDYSYKELRDKFIQNYSDSIKAAKYANMYFTKAQMSKDSIEICNGYYLRKYLDTDDLRFDLYDSIINISKSFKNDEFPSIAYFDKAAYLFSQNRYGLALENYIQAKKYNHGANKEDLSFLIDYNISILKLRIGEHKDALKRLKKVWRYCVENNYKEKLPDRYFISIFYLSDAYRKNEFLDSARTYTRLGIIDSKKMGTDKYYYDFLMLDGILSVNDDNVDDAISKLESIIPYVNENGRKINIAISYQYLGKAYLKKNQLDLALKNFSKVDSVMNGKDLVFLELLESYKFLRIHYKKSGDLKLELKYINKILHYYSIFDLKYRTINNKINDEYDTPILLGNQKEIIYRLKNTNKQKSTLFYISLIFIFFILMLLIYQLVQKRKHTKRFKKLLTSKTEKESVINHKEIKDKSINDSTITGISQEIIDKILERLTSFETELGFLDSSINSSEFSKLIGTNNSYFTKVFKYHKKTNFSSYLKEMRLDYAFKRLQEDSLFRKYSIKAIAKDCGFNNSESFSKSFYNKYGIYPSFYIKKLNSTLLK